MTGAAAIQVKRVRDPVVAGDGCRVLVDRLWPRGLAKAKADVAVWLKEIAPSTDLRRQFHGGEVDWPAFATLYRAELRANPPAVARLRALVAEGPVTLLYDSHDSAHNHARIIADYLAREEKD
jgi:uncharacterized protein YeaO (DUF488 family)